MRVVVFVKATADSEEGAMPTTELAEAMGRYNTLLIENGIMLSGDGLTPSSLGKRILFDGDSRTVTDGPFAETKEQFGGYSLIEAKNLDDAIQVAAKIPGARYGSVELRPIADDALTNTLGFEGA